MERVHAFVIDDSGFVIDSAEVIGGQETEFEITTPFLGHILHKPMWTGSEWVEGKTQDEFEEEEFLKSLIPSTEEVEDAEFGIKTLNILMEVGLI